jgi:hypothetical protein
MDANDIIKNFEDMGYEFVDDVKPKGLYEKIKEYYEKTPREEIERVWALSEEYDQFGITVDDFLQHISTSQIINKQIINLPDGEYNALWSAYSIEILQPSVFVDVMQGVKGINCKIKLLINNGNIVKYEYE